MKHTSNHEIHTDFDSNLETIASSAIHSITPQSDLVHVWYTAQKHTPYTRSLRSKIYIPVFGSVFAGVCAFVMILSVQNTTTPSLATLDTASTQENMLFSATTVLNNQETTKMNTVSRSNSNINTSRAANSEPKVINQLDSTLLATNRGSSDTFLQEADVETLNTLFE